MFCSPAIIWRRERSVCQPSQSCWPSITKMHGTQRLLCFPEALQILMMRLGSCRHALPQKLWITQQKTMCSVNTHSAWRSTFCSPCTAMLSHVGEAKLKLNKPRGKHKKREAFTFWLLAAPWGRDAALGGQRGSSTHLEVAMDHAHLMAVQHGLQDLLNAMTACKHHGRPLVPAPGDRAAAEGEAGRDCAPAPACPTPLRAWRPQALQGSARGAGLPSDTGGGVDALAWQLIPMSFSPFI